MPEESNFKAYSISALVFISLLAVAVGILLLSCTIKPEKINFGSDMCHFCQMTIVDRQHAAQYVTSKGKQFKFDAIECMLNEFSEKTTRSISKSPSLIWHFFPDIIFRFTYEHP